MRIKNASTFECHFRRRAHCYELSNNEQTPYPIVFEFPENFNLFNAIDVNIFSYYDTLFYYY